ncbi:MAG: sugar transferase, partial [Pseudomonadota bacterium]
MTWSKRVFDLVLATISLLILGPLMLVIALAILLRDGRPILYVSERMRAPDQAFRLLKFRTMTEDPSDSGVTGADKGSRITANGRFLRSTRLDELPQLFNILLGDLSFV